MDNLSIAILFGGKPEQTVECLESFKGHNIHLLENGVPFSASKYIMNNFQSEKATGYTVPENLGVAAGRNFLIDKIDTEWIFFVDNDITIKPGWEKEFKKALKKYPDTKVFIPRLFNKHLNSWENLYSFSLAQKGKAKTYVVKDGKTNKISGGASIIHRSLFEEIGKYNEEFFVGFEDFELSLRALKMNKPVEAIELKEIELVHDHREVQSKEDDEYLKVRYSAERLRHSYDLIKKLHNLELPDDGVKWAENKIKQMSSTDKPIRVAIYTYDQVRIGGIETFHKNWCKRMSKYYDITFYCHRGDPESIAELSQYVNVEIYNGQEIETDVFIYGIAWGSLPSKVKAKVGIQMVHGDYEWMKKDLHFEYKKMPIVTKHIAVGKNVAEKLKKVTGYEAEVIYNLLDPDVKVERVLQLISVMRLGHEKGLERMYAMAKELKNKNYKFIWHVFGDGTDLNYVTRMKEKFKAIPEVVFMGTFLNTASYVAASDYLVALSKSEGFSYSIYEALQVGTPCIVTDFPSAFEQVKDGENGFILKMDMSNLDVDKIYNTNLKGFKFKEFSTEKDWIKVLGGDGKEIPSTRKPFKMGISKVKVLRRYLDTFLGKRLLTDQEIEMPIYRAIELQKKNLVKIIDK
jgi:glycosyltransferase involved in cell wall biosynthesis